MLQNAAPLRKPARGPPNISYEQVSCTAPATENASFLEMPQNHHVLLTFDKVHNPLRLPHETTPERTKVFRTRRFFALLTWKRALRHNGVHFFDMSTSKSGPRMVCFAHFDLETCLAPQRRLLFRHLNFQKRSETEVFCTFWLGKCASCHNGVQLSFAPHPLL